MLLGLLLAAGGCRDDHVDAYRIPKEREVAADTALSGGVAPQAANPVAVPVAGAPSGNDEATAPGATAGAASLTWTAPSAWTPKALGPMRKGSFTVTAADGGSSADLSITAFPGAVGGEFANVNRWRGQLSLPPIAEPELAGATTRVVVGELTFTVVDLAGTGDQPQRILGAMAPFDQAMWFFKLTGPDALVAAEKPAFISFLKTVKVSATPRP
ncbi:MAG TPA: hypothetical protein VIM44_08890 [Rariglobus sp.]